MRQSYRFMQSTLRHFGLLACEVDRSGEPELRLAAGRFHIEKGVVKVVSSAAIRRQEKLITVQAPGSCKASDGRAPTHEEG